MHGGQVSQARRKFYVGSGLQPASLIGVQPRSLDSCLLTRDPVQMPEPERRGFSARAAPWNGDSYATVAIHAQQISPGALVTDEVELYGGRYEEVRGARRVRAGLCDRPMEDPTARRQDSRPVVACASMLNDPHVS